jgi:hypothetical protein
MQTVMSFMTGASAFRNARPCTRFRS